MAHPAHLTPKETVWLTILALSLAFVAEGLCMLRLWRQSDVLTAGLVIIGWFKEGLRNVLGKL